MPHLEVSDCVFSLQPGEWKAIVSGRIHGPFQSRGAAEAGMAGEQRREAARAKQAQETAYLSIPTNTPIETVLSTLTSDEAERRRVWAGVIESAREEEHMAAVATELQKFGYDARAEQTGGNILCVNIDGFPANGYWYAGTANEVWGMTFWDDDGGDYNLETDCPTTEPDPAKVAAAIHAAFVKAGHTFVGENPRYPRADWVYEVENDCTNLGYKAWTEYSRKRDSDPDSVVFQARQAERLTK